MCYQSLDSILINIRPMFAIRSLRREPFAKDFRSITNVKLRTGFDVRSVCVKGCVIFLQASLLGMKFIF